MELVLKIEGMHCGGCVNRVTMALKSVAGVTVRNVQVGSARVEYDPHAVAASQIEEAVNRIGFTATSNAG